MNNSSLKGHINKGGNPYISIIIPVKRDVRIIRCIEAILMQECSYNFEVIVVENDTHSRLKNLLQKYPIKVLLEKKPGQFNARNTGLFIARGRIVAFTDASCIPDKYWLSALVEPLVEAGNISCVGGKIQCIHSKNIVLRHQREFQVYPGLQYMDAILPLPYAPTGNIAFQKAILLEIGGFDGNLISGGDLDISWRIQMMGYKISYTNNAKVLYEGRDGFVSYYKQYFKYGLGHVLLFKKLQKHTSKLISLDSYPYKEFLKSIFMLVFIAPTRLMIYRDFGCFVHHTLKLLECLALAHSRLYGSIKYKIVFL